MQRNHFLFAPLLLLLLLALLKSPAFAHDTPPPPVTPLVLKEVATANVFPRVLAPDPIVQSWLPLIDSRQLTTYVGDLSGEWPALIGGAPYTITSRHSDSGQSIFNAVQYVEEHLQGAGLAVARHAWHATRPPNVIGQITGTVDPGRVYMLTAHLDSAAPPGPAPGADDNASGSAAVLAAAHLLSAYQWECTLRFALWTGEEQGLLGSRAYATAARAKNEDIRGVINLDMIGWNTPGSPPDMDFHASSTLTPTQDLAQMMADVVDVYHLNLNPQIVALGIGASDHASFWEQGYPAILSVEDYYPGRSDFNPHYHSAGDRLQALDVPYFTDVARAGLAGLVHMSDCLATGSLHGSVVRISDSAPVAAARLTMTHSAGHVYTATADALGRYTATLPAGDYQVEATANGFLAPAPITRTVEANDATAQNFVLARGALALSKTLVTAEPVRPGQEVRFLVQLTNTGDAPIIALPLSDSYPTAFLRFQESQPPPDDSLDDGLLTWSSLTSSLAPGVSLTVTTTFRALTDSSALPGGAVQNTASVAAAVVDGDGGGPQTPQALSPPSQASATVRALTPTGVTVGSFSATWDAGRVLLRWESSDESAVAAYRVVRSSPLTAPAASPTSPTAQPTFVLPAIHAGRASGGAYSIIDHEAAPGVIHSYTLQAQHLDGALVTVAQAATPPRPLTFLPVVAR